MLKVIFTKPKPSTRAVLVFATERKNNVDPRLRSQMFMNDLLTEQGQQRSRVIR